MIARFALILALLSGMVGVARVEPVRASTVTVMSMDNSRAGSLGQAIADVASNLLGIVGPGNVDSNLGESYTTPQLVTLNLNSVAAIDGWILESSETSNLGGSLNATANTIDLGDDKSNKQSLGVLHFDTSGLPDTAVITSVTLQVQRQNITGTDPFTTHGNLLVDIQQPYFGITASLVAGDFQSAAGQSAIASFDPNPVNNWYSASIDSAGYPLINLTGTTQFRLRFSLDDDNDRRADLIKFYSGEAAAANRPQLIVQYDVPPTTHTISGNVGVGGATLSYLDGEQKTAVTDGSGNYSLSVSHHWSGVITPDKAGYAFMPEYRNYTDVQENRSSQDYVAIPLYTISGNVRYGDVSLSYMEDGNLKTSVSNSNGDYSLQVKAGWSGTVTPSMPGVIFEPTSKYYTNVQSDQTAQNYQASIPVTTLADSGPGSLRQVIANAVSGEVITFHPDLAGQTIILTSALILDKDLTINGSGLTPQITISGNNTTNIVINPSMAVTISDVTIAEGFSSNSGGGIRASGSLTLLRSTLRNNYAVGGGGAISATADVNIQDSTFYQNQAERGGGALYFGGYGYATIVNTTIVDNQAVYGGALSIYGVGELVMTNSTIAGNSATNEGGAIFSIGSSPWINLKNSIVICRPEASSCLTSDIFFDSTNTIIGFGSPADFGLSDLGDHGGPTYTMALLAGSPAIDAGNDADCPAADQRGVPRAYGDHCDIGAYEAQNELRLIYVKWDADGANSGTSWADAYTDMQSALAVALAGDEIWVAAGIYVPTTTSDRTISFVLPSGVKIYGGFSGTETSRDQRDPTTNFSRLTGDIGAPDAGDNSYHVVRVENPSDPVVLDGLWISGGTADGNAPYDRGGGIYHSGGSLTVANTIFNYNYSVMPLYAVGNGEGGAIYSTLGTLTISKSTFYNNAASRGGAIMCNGGTLNATDVSFYGNVAASTTIGDGGAIYTSCNSTLVNTTFSANEGHHYAGAILTDNDLNDVNITNSTFYANRSLVGGGLLNYGRLIVTNSTFSNNVAPDGGAIKNGMGGTLSLRNSILANSQGGVDCIRSDSTPAVENINNLIETTGADLQSCGVSLLTSDPMLASLANNGGTTQTMALQTGSPAINAGNSAFCPVTDQRGEPRFDGACDLGAFEVQHVTIAGNTGTGGVTLSYAGGTTISDGDGNYALPVPHYWSGIITPSKSGYRFTPQSRTYTSIYTDQLAQDYIATPLVTISGNAGIAGATLSYLDDTQKSVVANSLGNYSFQVPVNWSGTVTPSKPGYIFSPLSRAYSNIQTNQTGQDYVATRLYTISGNVGVANAVLSYVEDGVSKNVLSASNGSYSFIVKSGWSGTVTPSKVGVTFTPANRTYVNVQADQTNANYVAYIAVISVSDAGPGSLRQAINDALPGATIHFDPTLAGQTITLASTLTSNKGLTIDGSGLNPRVEISGNDAVRIFYLGDFGTNITLKSLVLKNGHVTGAGGRGGAILVHSSGMTIDDVSFVDNSAYEGGAIYSDLNNVHLQISESTFDSNSAEQHGGAIYMQRSFLTLQSNSFRNNTAGVTGGALYLYQDDSYSIENNTFDNNSSYSGGAIHLQSINQPVIVRGNAFINNRAANIGGAIFEGMAYTGVLSLENNTFYANRAYQGGAVFTSDARIKNNTFSNNDAVPGPTPSGASLYLWAPMDIKLYNNIMANNTGGGECHRAGSGVVALEGGNNLIEDGSTLCFPTLAVDPMLGPLTDPGDQTQMMALLSGSPAINAGNDANCPATDQRGVTRPQGSHCDIGAYEIELYTISGNAGAPGVILSYADMIFGVACVALPDGSQVCTPAQPTPASHYHYVTSDQDGNYSFQMPKGWIGTVVPSKPGYTFSPVKRTYFDLASDQTGQNYTASLVDFALPPDPNSTRRIVPADAVPTYDALNFEYLDISGNGRYVAYVSNSPDLVPGDANQRSDVFVWDRLTDTTRRISVNSGGEEADDHSFFPSLSKDGRYVAFESWATNLDPACTWGRNIFVHDMQTGRTICASVNASGEQGGSTSDRPKISADGRYVVYKSFANNLVSGDTNNHWDVFVFDIFSRTTVRASVSSTGVQGNSYSENAAISGDGRYVAFWSNASTLVNSDTNGSYDIFVRDMLNSTTSRVSVNSSGAEANGSSFRPAISENGRFIAFASHATNLVDGDTNATVDVFVHDTQTATTSRVSLSSNNVQGNNISTAPTISSDGRFVAFDSNASNLVSNDTNFRADIFVRDRLTNRTSRVSVASDGSQANNESLNASLSSDGRYVVFESQATNLAGPAVPNRYKDAYLHERDAVPPAVVSVTRANANPTSGPQVDFNVMFSEPVTGVDAGDFVLTANGLLGGSIASVSGSNDIYSVRVNTGTGSGTLRIDVVDNDSIVDAASNPLGGDGAGNGNFTAGESYSVSTPTTGTLTLDSIAANDGGILESSETSNLGGSLNTALSTFDVGDDKANKQYVGVLHFDTSNLPDNAVITSVTLRVQRQSITGTDPFTTHGSLVLDIQKPYFGTTAALLASDFQAAPGVSAVSSLDPVPVNNWYSATIANTGYAYIDATGTTQFRLRFSLDDNNDLGMDSIKFYSGEATVTSRPQLIIQYYIP